MAVCLLPGGVASAQGTVAPAPGTPPEPVMDDSFRAMMNARLHADPVLKKYKALVKQAWRVLQTNPAEAEKILLEAITLKSPFLDPSLFRANEGLATAYLLQKKYRACIKAYERRFPDDKAYGSSEDPLMLADYASAYLAIGEIGRATQISNRAVSRLEILEGQPQVPLLDPEQAHSVSEVRGMIHLARGMFYRQAWMDALAVAELQSATRAMPGSAVAHYYLAELYDLTDKPADAVAEYDKVSRLGFGNAALLEMAAKKRKDAARSLPPPK